MPRDTDERWPKAWRSTLASRYKRRRRLRSVVFERKESSFRQLGQPSKVEHDRCCLTTGKIAAYCGGCRSVNVASRWHLGAGFTVAALAVHSWSFGWNGWVSAFAVFLCNLYLTSILVEASFRAQQERKVLGGLLRPKPRRFIEFPEVTWSLLQVQFLLAIAILGFGNMYIRSGDVHYQEAATSFEQPSHRNAGSPPPKVDPTQLVDRVDAAYYSAVTFTTVGCGDFAPTSGKGRLLVLWQIGTTILMLLAMFPLVVGRISDF